MALDRKKFLRPGPEKIASNVWHNVRKGYRQVGFYLPQNTQIMLCAGGPSLAQSIDEIRRNQLDGMEVVCIGNTGHFLMQHGIKINGHVILDGAPRNRSFVVPTRDTRYFIASQCDPSVFDAVKNHKYVFIWHCGLVADEKRYLDQYYGKMGWFAVLGGSFATLRAISLMTVLGYKYMHLYGFDSCIMEDKHHAYTQLNADGHKEVEVLYEGRRFRVNLWMLDQATQFWESTLKGHFKDAEMVIHGDGLISHMVKTRAQPTWSISGDDEGKMVVHYRS